MRIQTFDLSKTYEKKNTALKNLTLDLNLNGIFSIIGRNGAGKTTFVRIMSTELMPTSGNGFINEMDVVSQATEVRQQIAVVPQEARPLPWLTPLQTVSSYLMWRGYSYREANEKGKEALRELGLEGKEREKSRKLSGGQKRKLMVATVISSEAPVVFLDEPTTGLDYLSRKELWQLLSKMKKDRLIILTTHYLEEAEILGDQIMILDSGKLVDIGKIDDLRAKVKLPYVLKVYSDNFKIEDNELQVHPVSEKETFVYGSATKIYGLMPYLVTNKMKFTVEEASLSNIFEQYLGGEEGENEKEDW
ncbi:MAG: ABC transporter ATP-binding protein [Thermoplasmatales archaeon]|nr:ABC transporter ATP-binding protein [Thermoplasmatales archaeon]